MPLRDDIMGGAEYNIPVNLELGARMRGVSDELREFTDNVEQFTNAARQGGNAAATLQQRVIALIGQARQFGQVPQELLDIHDQLEEISRARIEDTQVGEQQAEMMQRQLSLLREHVEQQRLLEVGRFRLPEAELGQIRALAEPRPGEAFGGELEARVQEALQALQEDRLGLGVLRLRDALTELDEARDAMQEGEEQRFRELSGLAADLEERAQGVLNRSEEIERRLRMSQMSVQDLLIAGVTGQATGEQVGRGLSQAGMEALAQRAPVPPGMLRGARELGARATAGELLGGGRAGAALGMLARGAVPITAVAGAGALGFQAWQQGIPGVGGGEFARREYAGLVGEATWGEGLAHDIQARTMAMSPFLSGQQARQIMQTGMREGLRGQVLDDAMGFMAENFRSFNMDFADSMEVYRTNVIEAQGSTEELSSTLNVLGGVAADTGASAEVLRQNFANVSGVIAGLGGGAGTTAAAGTIGTMFAQNEVLRNLDPTQMLQSQAVRIQLGQQFGVGPMQVPAIINRLGQQPGGGAEIAQAYQTALGGVAQTYGDFPQGVTAEQIQADPSGEMQYRAQMVAGQMGMPGVTVQQAAELVETMMNPRAMEENLALQAEQLEQREVQRGGGLVETALRPIFGSRGAQEVGRMGLSTITRQLGRLNIFQRGASRRRNRMGIALEQFEREQGVEDPLLREWVRTEEDFTNIAVRDPNDPERLIPILDYIEEAGGDEAWQALRSGELQYERVQPGTWESAFGPQTVGEAMKVGETFAPGYEAARQLGLTADAKRLVEIMDDVTGEGVNYTATRESARWGHNYPNEANR